MYQNYNDGTQNSSFNFHYQGHIHFGGTNPACYFALVDDEDKYNISSLLNGNKKLSDNELKKYCLSNEIIESYQIGDINSFISKRQQLIIKLINTFLSKVLDLKNLE